MIAASAAEALEALRAAGWFVAVHNDYTLNGERCTFWLFTRGTRCVRGEGRTDTDALAQVYLGVKALREADQETWRRAQDATARVFQEFKDRRRRDRFDVADCRTPYEEQAE